MSDTTDFLTGPAGQDAEPVTSAPAAAPPAPAGADGGPPADPRSRRRGTGLSGMLLPELQALATSLGITGVGRMRKGDLVNAIQARQGGNGVPPGGGQLTLGRDAAVTGQPDSTARAGAGAEPRDGFQGGRGRDGRPRRSASRPAGSPEMSGGPADGAARPERPVDGTAGGGPADAGAGTAGTRTGAGAVTDEGARSDAGARTDAGDRTDARRADGGARTDADARTDAGARTDERPERADRDRPERSDRDRPERSDRDRPERGDRPDRGGDQRDQRRDRNQGGDRQGGDRQGGDRQGGGDRDNQRAAQGGGDRQRDGLRDGQGGGQGGERDDDDFDGRGGSRRRGRFRDRNRRNRGDRFGSDQAEPVIAEDDVLLPVAGILDILDNYAFVRTSGYLTGPNDVYVSLAQVRRYGLRRGDAITGAVRQPREGERRDKYNALVRLDTINGMDPEQARTRPEFHKLTPLYPQDRLRLETEPHVLTSRVIDLVMPIGKGQRALIVSPPKAGKTMILQTIANAITTNNPECHLMVVLVDERPEEVTDMQRAVKGEVIASTFDRPPTDHTTVAELSIERAKRLVELGHDVVVLLDNITRLGRAYNLAAPASGRILSGGVDSTALYPPKRFLGAARNIEHGGSLTIMATALIETGSTMDTVIFEEFKGTGNAELVLSRKIANKRVFPAVDVIASGTRKEEILLAPEELVIVHKLRRVLNALDPEQAIDLLLDRIKQSRTNVEFLMQIAKSTPGQD